MKSSCYSPKDAESGERGNYGGREDFQGLACEKRWVDFHLFQDYEIPWDLILSIPYRI